MESAYSKFSAFAAIALKPSPIDSLRLSAFPFGIDTIAERSRLGVPDARSVAVKRFVRLGTRGSPMAVKRFHHEQQRDVRFRNPGPRPARQARRTPETGHSRGGGSPEGGA